MMARPSLVSVLIILSSQASLGVKIRQVDSESSESSFDRADFCFFFTMVIAMAGGWLVIPNYRPKKSAQRFARQLLRAVILLGAPVRPIIAPYTTWPVDAQMTIPIRLTTRTAWALARPLARATLTW